VNGTPGGGTPALPTITGHPQPQDVCSGGIATFNVAATGSGTLTYRWQRNGANITDGGHYSGATTATLTVTGVDANDTGQYLCVVTNAGGSTPSNSAALTLRPTVAVDLDGDCDVDGEDLATLASCLSGPGISHDGSLTCRRADSDGDLDIDQTDFGIFQRCLSGAGNPASPQCAD